MKRYVLLGLVFAAACGSGAGDTEVTTPGAAPSLEAAATSASSCVPPVGPFTQQELEELCDDPEVAEISPPPVGGVCKFEILLTENQFFGGQGWSEGHAEISYEATATAMQGPEPPTTAVGAETEYIPGEDKGLDDNLGTYTVPVGQTRHVEVCIELTEHDNGGANGQDDVASGCTTVALQCRGGDANGDGRADGAVIGRPQIGPLQYCGPNTCNGQSLVNLQVLPVDGDMDGVANSDDPTPLLCDEARKGKTPNGVLLYWNYEDDPVSSLVQAAGIDLTKLFDTYDHVVLVADPNTSQPMGSNARMFRDADVTYPPTREGLLDGFRHLTSRGYWFDVFVFSHGYSNGAADSEFEALGDDEISGAWLESATEPCIFGTARGGLPIMAHWTTACIGARQNDSWMAIGAQVTSAAKDIYFYPQTWNGFIDDWVAGEQYDDAVDDSLTFIVESESELFLRQRGKLPPYFCAKDDISTPLPFDGPGVVTDTNQCAYDFFSNDVGNFTEYSLENYDPTLSGALNMAESSRREFAGNDNLTFGEAGITWP